MQNVDVCGSYKAHPYAPLTSVSVVDSLRVSERKGREKINLKLYKNMEQRKYNRIDYRITDYHQWKETAPFDQTFKHKRILKINKQPKAD